MGGAAAGAADARAQHPDPHPRQLALLPGPEGRPPEAVSHDAPRLGARDVRLPERPALPLLQAQGQPRRRPRRLARGRPRRGRRLPLARRLRSRGGPAEGLPWQLPAERGDEPRRVLPGAAPGDGRALARRGGARVAAAGREPGHHPLLPPLRGAQQHDVRGQRGRRAPPLLHPPHAQPGPRPPPVPHAEAALRAAAPRGRLPPHHPRRARHPRRGAHAAAGAGRPLAVHGVGGAARLPPVRPAKQRPVRLVPLGLVEARPGGAAARGASQPRRARPHGRAQRPPPVRHRPGGSRHPVGRREPLPRHRAEGHLAEPAGT
mmetsp:Transcript_34936/g.82849  ORF Transcript_34936/g.82849 Transcript_34936/m.82849 type:complete len:319 (+) Transcript_34936:2767-3723(+)